MKILDLTAVELAERIRRGEIDAMESLEAVFERISEREEQLHCYLVLDREGARAKARELQKRRSAGEGLGLLAGVPVAVKDNLCTKGMRTTCGSRMLENFVPPYDATAVWNLRNADAIILGKTNLDEFGMGNTTESSYFGLTRNPWNEERSAGGSSGGSAAAVASGECYAAIGTDTGGSVRQPASHCGVVGLKPTYGTVSRSGLIAYCSSMDQAGPVTKDVRDSAAILGVIAARDPKDATSLHRDDLSFMEDIPQDVEGIRIGIPADNSGNGLDPEIREAIWSVAMALKERGALLEEFDLGITKYVVPAYYTIACGEASSNLERYDGMKYGLRVSADGLQETYRKTRTAGFGAEVRRRILLGTFALSEGYYDEYYLTAMKVRRLIRDAYDKAFLKYDVLLGPTSPIVAPKLGETGMDPLASYLADVYTVPANLTGMPAMSLPCAIHSTGLPIGVQLTAALFQEKTLFRVGMAWEQAREKRQSQKRDVADCNSRNWQGKTE